MKPGYTPSEWQQLRENESGFLIDLVSTVAPFGGITSNALAHLRRDWLTFNTDHIRIDIPSVASCNTTRMAGGRHGGIAMLNPRDQPCWHCANQGETKGFENKWDGSKWDGSQKPEQQTAILHHEIAEPAVESLRTIFQTYDRPELGATPSAIQRAAREFSNTPDSGTQQYMKLLRTGPILYHHYGLDTTKIANLTPYTESTAIKIIYSTPEVQFDRIDTRAFLRFLTDHEPATVATLAEELDYNRNSLRRRLKELEKRDRVTATNTGRGRPAAEWKTTTSWDEPLSCNHCEFETHSLVALSQHSRRKHPSSD